MKQSFNKIVFLVLVIARLSSGTFVVSSGRNSPNFSIFRYSPFAPVLPLISQSSQHGLVTVRLRTFALDAASTEENESTHSSSLKRVIRLRGPVDKGWQRGGKKLGIPTANLPESMFAGALAEVSTGVYFGWAVIEGGETVKKGRGHVYKAVANVGYSPTFQGEENCEKIVEAHLIVDDGSNNFIEGDFYGETMRLCLLGFLRPERKFPSLPDLIEAIQQDVAHAKQALDEPPFSDILKNDPFIAMTFDRRKSNTCVNEWVGSGGEVGAASWEFEEMESALRRCIVKD